MAQNSKDAISVDDLLAAFGAPSDKTRAKPKATDGSAGSEKKKTSKKSGKKSGKKKISKNAPRDVGEKDLLAALGIDLEAQERDSRPAARSEAPDDSEEQRNSEAVSAASSAATEETSKPFPASRLISDAVPDRRISSGGAVLRESSLKGIGSLQSGIDHLSTSSSRLSEPQEIGEGVYRRSGFNNLRFDRRIKGVMSESSLEPQHFASSKASADGEISDQPIVRRNAFSTFAPSMESSAIGKLSDASAQAVMGAETGTAAPLSSASSSESVEGFSGFTPSFVQNAAAAPLTSPQSVEQGAPPALGQTSRMPFTGDVIGAGGYQAETGAFTGQFGDTTRISSPQQAVGATAMPAQQASVQQAPIQMQMDASSQTATGYSPQSGQGFLNQASYASRQAEESVRTEEKRSKATVVLGVFLIVVALLCAVFAVALLTGIFDVKGNVSPDETSTSSSLASVSSASDIDDDAEGDGSQSLEGAPAGEDTLIGSSTAVYSYVVRGLDGTAHEATETAVFNSDGILNESTIEIFVNDQETADSLLSQLKDEFGDTVKDSEATESHVLIVLDINRDDLTKEAYTELLAANMVEFEQLS